MATPLLARRGCLTIYSKASYHFVWPPSASITGWHRALIDWHALAQSEAVTAARLHPCLHAVNHHLSRGESAKTAFIDG
jgi:hypothetical protein